MRQWWALVGWLAPTALLLLLVTSNVRFAANSLPLYEYLFERNHVVERTGITEEGLRQVGADFQPYFSTDAEPLTVSAVVNGERRDLFGPDEVAHMGDVKQLFLKVYQVQAIAGLFLAFVAAAVIVLQRGRVLLTFATWARRGAVVTGVSILVIGLASLVAFDALFDAFHAVGFPQGNFIFDPRTDYLVRVFPQGFWRDITMVIGILTLVEVGLLFVVGLAVAHKLDHDVPEHRPLGPGIRTASRGRL